jgi:hypothetical protein
MASSRKSFVSSVFIAGALSLGTAGLAQAYTYSFTATATGVDGRPATEIWYALSCD